MPKSISRCASLKESWMSWDPICSMWLIFIIYYYVYIIIIYIIVILWFFSFYYNYPSINPIHRAIHREIHFPRSSGSPYRWRDTILARSVRATCTTEVDPLACKKSGKSYTNSLATATSMRSMCGFVDVPRIQYFRNEKQIIIFSFRTHLCRPFWFHQISTIIELT